MMVITLLKAIRNEGLSKTDLSRRSFISYSHLLKTLDFFVGHGFVTDKEEKGKNIIINITPKGLGLLEAFEREGW